MVVFRTYPFKLKRIFMPFFSFTYYPVRFFSILMLETILACFFASCISRHKTLEKWQFLLIFIHLCIPCILALFMIYGSKNKEMIEDFRRRLFLFSIPLPYMFFILLFMPCVMYVATWISIWFGQGTQQLDLCREISVMKGWSVLGLVIPFLAAPLIEEVSWRGYGVDSIRSTCTLLHTSLLFGLLWAAWHLPLFFIKGYYHYDLWQMGSLYTINFFISVLAIAFIMNYVYYKVDRSIAAMIVFHAMLNISCMVLQSEQITKCIATGILCAVAAAIFMCDKVFFLTH